jgi:hypothetical protein
MGIYECTLASVIIVNKGTLYINNNNDIFIMTE